MIFLKETDKPESCSATGALAVRRTAGKSANNLNRILNLSDMKTKLSVAAFLLVFSLPAYSQLNTPSVVNATGSSGSKDGITLDWSVGEMSIVSTTESRSDKLVLTNGFIQPVMVSKHQNLPAFGADEITVLPNPTHGNCVVKIETKQQGTITIVVQDAYGKNVATKRTVSFVGPVVERINLTAQPAGTYLIQITLTPLPGFIGKSGSLSVVKI